VAGDDLVQRVVAAVVLPRLQTSIEAAGGRHAGEKLRELFGGDIGGQDQQVVQKRRQFALRVLAPLAVALLEYCETAEEFDHVDLRAAEVLGLGTGEAGAQAPARLPPDLIRYFEGAAASVGAADWRLADLVIRASREDLDAIAREVLQKVLGNMGEVVDHLGVDVLLLTGRPSRLPAVRSILEEMLAVPPHRLVSMHRYRTGRWFPFRDPVTQRIGDPKSTVAVGGMLIALADKHIANFTVSPGAFRMRSTARYIGEMDLNEQIPDARLLFRDVDLDAATGGGQTATVAMFAPVHIGARQLPLARWTTTPLYRLDFANAAARKRPTPVRVSLERAEFDEGDEDRPTSEEVLRREALREAFRIAEVEDGAGDGMKPSDIVLKLHTLGFQDEYWIDTGVFQI
jgi:hypothetical protein